MRAVHAMHPGQGSYVKRKGHKNEKDFNNLFGNSDAPINYSGSSSDCILVDEKLISILKKNLGIEGLTVSLKGGKTIQIHLGFFPELTRKDFWREHLCKVNLRNKECTSSKHGISFEDQNAVLKKHSFWKKYLGKGDILCYRASKDNWVFFNMDDVLNFIINNFEWRLLETGRIKGDYNGKQYITYEYRPEPHKMCFVLGAHGGKKGKEFIELLMEHIPYHVEVR